MWKSRRNKQLPVAGCVFGDRLVYVSEQPGDGYAESLQTDPPP